MNRIRYAFAGDREVAVAALKVMVEDGFWPEALLVSAPDRATHANELVEMAGVEDSRIARGAEFRDPSWIETLASLDLDYLICVHFPYLVPPEVLRIPREGVLNLHPAYLPYNRGWHTPSWAILEGTPAGATLHFMDEGLDTGDVVHQRELEVRPCDTADSLYGRIIELEKEVFAEAWPKLRDRRYRRSPQPKGGSARARRDLLTDGVRKIDWDVNSRDLFRQLRALTTNSPAEAAYFDEAGRRYRVRVSIQPEDAE